MQKNNYYSIIGVISDLQSRGFFLDFSLVGSRLLCAQEKFYLGPEEFDILEIYHFRGHPPVRNDTVIYAIATLGNGLKGILLDSHYPSTSTIPSILTSKLRKFRV